MQIRSISLQQNNTTVNWKSRFSRDYPRIHRNETNLQHLTALLKVIYNSDLHNNVHTMGHTTHEMAFKATANTWSNFSTA